jgi:hypothetical protein
MPLQTTSDCGTETVQVYGLANTLRYAHMYIHTDILLYNLAQMIAQGKIFTWFAN